MKIVKFLRQIKWFLDTSFEDVNLKLYIKTKNRKIWDEEI